MNKSKILVTIITVVIIASASWYFFLKGYNYKIRFNTSQPVGTIYTTLANWDTSNLTTFDSISKITKKPFNKISYVAYKSDSIYNYEWDINKKKDSVTQVTAYVTDKENSLIQNFTVPFKKNEFVKTNLTEVEDVMRYLKGLDDVYCLRIFKDSIITVEPVFCAYVPVKSKISRKAQAMFQNIHKVMGYIRGNEIELDGNPFLMVTNLDIEKGDIEFDFCFPIKKQDNLPPTQIIKFKSIKEFKALKAIYNGNYRSTEYAWFELINYAKNKGIETLQQPMEIYKNDPQIGTNSMDWVAEVYLPLKN